ncbi:MAG: L-threonine 3-dehydrogenase [Armatimonadetes bacterium RBG_16_67_12]|nr:MAG: L-threonine 3-dehydrogenase [Armatimonadetes bacterium RBG_16_67_12]
MTDQMLAAVFEGEGRLTITPRPVPRVAAPDDVLLAVRAAGICGTDVHILAVPPGHPATPGVIMGHEYTAEVLQTGPRVAHLAPGDRVVVDPSIWCGYCEYCQRGLTNLCDRMEGVGIFRDGGFAPFSVLPARAVYKISPTVPAEIAALAEPLADVLSGVRKLQPTPGESAVVLGAGPIGLLYVLLLRAAGVRPLLVAEVAAYRAAAARGCGADEVIDPRQEDLATAVRRETRLGADMVVDAVGTLLEDAVRCVRKGGRIVLFGMNEHARPTLKQYDITKYEYRILGSYIARGTYPQATALLESGMMDFGRLITHRMPLAEIRQGIELLRRAEALKIAVVP